MPTVQQFGRFVVIGSSTEWMKAPKRRGWKHMALIEVANPDGPLPWKIDPRLKTIKRIVLISEPIGTWAAPGKWMWPREWDRYCRMAERWNAMYPLHIVAKDWPHALPVYSD